MVSNPNPTQLCPVTSDKHYAVFRSRAKAGAVLELPVVAWALAHTSADTNTICGVVVTDQGPCLAEALAGFVGYRMNQSLIAFLMAHDIHPDDVQALSPENAGGTPG